MQPENLRELDRYAELIADAYNEDFPEGPISTRQLIQMLASRLTGRPNQQLGGLSDDQVDQLLASLVEIAEGRSILETRFFRFRMPGT